MAEGYKRGDFVVLEHDGQKMDAMVVLVSKNQESIGVMFDGILIGYAGAMPLLLDRQGRYRDVLTDKVVVIKAKDDKTP